MQEFPLAGSSFRINILSVITISSAPRPSGDEPRTEQAQAPNDQAETRSQQAMRASELSYRRLFEPARAGILILRVETGRISDVNRLPS
jgi:hypothetical protein